MKVARDGSGAPTTLASGQLWGAGIAVDDAYVYWVVNGAEPDVGTVMKVSIDGAPDGGAPVTLASGLATPRSIAIDATSVYWTNEEHPGAERQDRDEGGQGRGDGARGEVARTPRHGPGGGTRCDST